MKTGRDSKELTYEQIEVLRFIQIEERLTVTALAAQIDGNLKHYTLARALRGQRIWAVDHEIITRWLNSVPVKETGK